jgi:KRAB domain-containing zinc finger protein
MQNSHSMSEIHCEWPDCGKVFKGREQYRKHIRRHETKASHSCELCGKSFGKKRQLESHIMKIHGPFHCQKCPRVFSSRKEFVLHIKTEHREGVRCPYCDDATCATNESLRQHIKDSHPTFPCTFCSSTFSRARDLKAHVLLKHLDENDELVKGNSSKRTCPACGVMFSSVSNLRCHMRTQHEGVKKFECDTCGKQFSHKHVLQRHVRNVHQERRGDSETESSAPENEPLVTVSTPLRVLTVSAGPV